MMASERFRKFAIFVCCLATAASIFLLAVGNVTGEDDSLLGGYRCRELKTPWFQISGTGERTGVTLPGTLPTDENGMASGREGPDQGSDPYA